MSKFLDTCDFLSAHHKALLNDADLDEPAAFQHLSHEAFVKKFKGKPYELSEGKIGKLFTATRITTVPQITVTSPEPLTRAQRIEKALRANPVDFDVLEELQVSHVVAPKMALDVEATMEMLESPTRMTPPTWRGKKVIALSDLRGTSYYRNPRNSTALQGKGTSGVDEVTGEPWGELGLDGICVAFYGERHGFFAGMTDAVVIREMKLDEDGKPSKLRAKVEQRMADTGMEIKQIEDSVVVREQRRPPTPPEAPLKLSGHRLRDMQTLLVDLFSPSELRRIAREVDHNYNAEISQTINWDAGDGIAGIAYAWSDALHRHGILDRAEKLRSLLVAERPRRRDQIFTILPR